jgi:hypothetical protein
VRFYPSSEGLSVVERKKKIIGFNLDCFTSAEYKGLKPADATERETMQQKGKQTLLILCK